MRETIPVVLLLIRHGEQEQVGDDGPLTDRGRQQAQALAAAHPVRPGDRLVTSTLRRARQTAEAFGVGADGLDDLAEFRFGPSWDWQRAADGGHLELWQPTHRLAGGESLAEFQQRVAALLDAIAVTAPPGRVLMCTHSGVIDAALRWAFGCSPDTAWTTESEVGHTSVTELHHWPTGRHPRGAPRHTVLVRVGDVGHLPPDLVTGRQI